MKTSSKQTVEIVAGLDRSDRKVDLHIIDKSNGSSRCETLDSSPEQLHRWLLDLHQQQPAAHLSICLEQPAGLLIPFLETYSWITLYPINPISLKKFREAFVTSNAKDDSTDAYFQAFLLDCHADQLRPWQPQDSQTRLLQQLVEHRRAVIDERTTLTNRLQSLLKVYFPQALQLCGEDLWRPMATGFLLKWPTLLAVQKAAPHAVSQFYHLHQCRSKDLLKERQALIKAAVPVSDEPALNQSFAIRVQLICHQLQQVATAVDHFNSSISDTFAGHPDRNIFSSLPGAGPVLAPRLLGALGAERDHFDSPESLQCYSGVAPVTKQSGKSRHVHRRLLCPLFIRQSFHEYANQSILWCRWAAAFYLGQRLKGKPHHTAVRALAFKWQRVIWRCWTDHTSYDDSLYEKVLRDRRSPVVKLFKNIVLGQNPFTHHDDNPKKSPSKTSVKSKNSVDGSPQR